MMSGISAQGLWRCAGIVIVLLLGSLPMAEADEGQWPPDGLEALDWADLERRGLQLSGREIWNREDGGLMASVLRLNGCSASFISPDGLIVTNHHCAYRAIQGASSTENNFLRDGFLARRWQDEPVARGYRARILLDLRDVTHEIAPRLADAEDDHARFRAREAAIKDLVAACEARPHVRCRVGSEFGGSRYMLLESLELKDIRLVYAPPDAVGRFGGDVDNWMWPRHTGDFALLRAYVGTEGDSRPYAADNVPYRPRRHLEISTRGVRPGDLVMVMGYPGSTSRYLPASAIAYREQFFYPERIATTTRWMALLEEATAGREEGALRVAPLLRGYGNRLKNAQGMVAGLRRNRVLEAKENEEAAMLNWLAEEPSRLQQHGSLLTELAALYEDPQDVWRREYLLSSLPAVSRTFGFARRITVNARERNKPDAERKRGYQERDQERLLLSLRTGQDTLDPPADRAVTMDILQRLMALPEAAAVEGLESSLAAVIAMKDTAASAAVQPEASPDLDVNAAVAALYSGTRLTDATARESMFALGRDELERLEDPFIRLALLLEGPLDELERKSETRSGSLSRLMPEYARLLMQRRERVYPDANATLRLSVATVKGYRPADAVWMEPQTTLGGMLDKRTDAPPFQVPEKVLQAGRGGRWWQAGLDDLPLCFLADADTTGGNSGSPVVNGKGQLVGLNFDRVFENVAGDYGYNRARSRNVSVDVRFLLWMLEEVEGAWPILREIGLEPAPGKLPASAER